MNTHGWGALSNLHAQANGNPSSIAILGTGISIKSLAKLFESAFSYKAPATRIPTMPAAPAMKYHGGAAHVASTHGPQAIFVGFSSTTSALVPTLHALVVHLNLASALKWASCASPLASAILVGISARSVLLPYSDMMHSLALCSRGTMALHSRMVPRQ